MGLLLSILVVCVGVIEVLSCYQHFQYGVLRYATNIYENARRRNSLFLNYKSRRTKLKSEAPIAEIEEDVEASQAPYQFSEEFEAAIKDIAKSQELHLLQLQQQQLQLQLQIVKVQESQNTETAKKEESAITTQKPKLLDKDEKIDLVKKLLNRPAKPARSVSMPETIITKKDFEISKVINELATETIDEIAVDPDVVTKEFDKIFEESENVLKSSKRLIEKRPSLTEVAFTTESLEEKVFGGLEGGYATSTLQQNLQEPAETQQFAEASVQQEMLYAQKAAADHVLGMEIVADVAHVPHLDKSTSIDLTSISTSTCTDLETIPVHKSTSMDFDNLIPISKSTSMDFDDLLPATKSTSTDFAEPLSKSTSMDFSELLALSKSTSTDLIPVNKSTSMDFSELIPINKSTSVDFSHLIPVNRSTSMDFNNLVKDSSTQMEWMTRNSSTDLEDFFSVSESEDEETICVDLRSEKKKRKNCEPADMRTRKEYQITDERDGETELSKVVREETLRNTSVDCSEAKEGRIDSGVAKKVHQNNQSLESLDTNILNSNLMQTSVTSNGEDISIINKSTNIQKSNLEHQDEIIGQQKNQIKIEAEPIESVLSGSHSEGYDVARTDVDFIVDNNNNNPEEVRTIDLRQKQDWLNLENSKVRGEIANEQEPYIKVEQMKSLQETKLINESENVIGSLEVEPKKDGKRNEISLENEILRDEIGDRVEGTNDGPKDQTVTKRPHCKLKDESQTDLQGTSDLAVTTQFKSEEATVQHQKKGGVIAESDGGIRNTETGESLQFKVEDDKINNLDVNGTKKFETSPFSSESKIAQSYTSVDEKSQESTRKETEETDLKINQSNEVAARIQGKTQSKVSDKLIKDQQKTQISAETPAEADQSKIDIRKKDSVGGNLQTLIESNEIKKEQAKTDKVVDTSKNEKSISVEGELVVNQETDKVKEIQTQENGQKKTAAEKSTEDKPLPQRSQIDVRNEESKPSCGLVSPEQKPPGILLEVDTKTMESKTECDSSSADTTVKLVPSTPQDNQLKDESSDSTISEELLETKEKPNTTKEAFWLIFSGEYTKAMSKDWHSGHFSCWQCDEALTGQRYVLRDDHPYCIKCYESVFANVCEECNKIIGIDSKDLSYKDKHWHEACFLCNKCRVSLVDKQFGSKADKIYCGNCYDAQFASRCDGCGEIFRAGTKKMEYKTRQWHEKCFCCCVCKTAIGTKSFIPREQEIYCATCYEEKFATRCVKCNKIITSGGVTYKNEPWHRECFTCTNCNTSLAGQRFTSRDEKPYCADCFGELFAKRCTACSKPITGIGGTRFISFEDRHWHNDCFICASCKTSLVGRGFITDGDDIICPECAKQKLM